MADQHAPDEDTGAPDVLREVIRQSVIWADWCGGEGICSPKSEGLTDPDEFMGDAYAALGEPDDLPQAIVAALDKRLAAQRPASDGWRPIETAPKDGDEILGFEDRNAVILTWEETLGRWYDSHGISEVLPVPWTRG